MANGSGERSATDSIQAVGADEFARGHFSRDEGGPKGIDLTHDGSLLIASCEEQPLVIFDVRAILGGTSKTIGELEAIPFARGDPAVRALVANSRSATPPD
jgi:hypothetical protein